MVDYLPGTVLRSRAWLLALALGMGCVPDDCYPEQPAAGETCVFTTDGGEPYTTVCSGELVCDSAGTGVCVEPGTEVPQCEVHGDECTDAEWCDHEWGCKPRGDIGDQCANDSQCLSRRCDETIPECVPAP